MRSQTPAKSPDEKRSAFACAAATAAESVSGTSEQACPMELTRHRRCHKRCMRPPTAPLERGRMISSPKSKARQPCTLAQQHMLAADSPTAESLANQVLLLFRRMSSASSTSCQTHMSNAGNAQAGCVVISYLMEIDGLSTLLDNAKAAKPLAVQVSPRPRGSCAQLSGGYPLLSPQLPKKGAGDENSP